MNKKTMAGLAAFGAVLGAATAAGIVAHKKKQKRLSSGSSSNVLPPKRNIYFAGGGIAALAGAYYLIRDCKIPGDCIHIFEESSNIGGAFNIAGDNESGFVCVSPKILSLRNHANLMDMLKGVPSANLPDMSVKEEIINYMNANPVAEHSRLIDEYGGKIDSVFGLSRLALKYIKAVMSKKDDELSEITIDDFFGNVPDFFSSELWLTVSTAFMLMPSSSAVELKHILNCIAGEIPELFSMKSAVRSQFNMQETIIDALEQYLSSHNVNFATHCRVLDVDFDEDSDRINAIHLNDNGTAKTFYLNKNDMCIITNGSISECATIGDYNYPAPEPKKAPASASLWSRMAAKRPRLGDPDKFFGDYGTEIISFTITARSSMLLDYIKQYTSNTASGGILTTFTDSPWGLTLSCVPQPYFTSQSDDVTVICGYGVNVEKEGRFIDKQMRHASGAEILFELVKHLKLEDRWEEITEDIINVIPCAMPYAAASSLPYSSGDKPLVVPFKNGNFAFIGQFAKLGCGISFSSEYAVRTAREAVYRLTGTKKNSAPPPRANAASYVRMFMALKK